MSTQPFKKRTGVSRKPIRDPASDARIYIEVFVQKTDMDKYHTIVTKAYNKLIHAVDLGSLGGVLYASNEYEQNLQIYLQIVRSVIKGIAARRDNIFMQNAAKEKLREIIAQLRIEKGKTKKICSIAIKLMKKHKTEWRERGENTISFCSGALRIYTELINQGKIQFL